VDAPLEPDHAQKVGFFGSEKYGALKSS